MKEEDTYLPREIKFLVVHCSATRCDRPYPVERLRADHLARGFKDIGYHFYILRNGDLVQTRPMGEPGAHAKGFNLHSIGICYEGGLDSDGRPHDTRTPAQIETLRNTLQILKRLYPKAVIKGHYQLTADIHKACPCFDAEWEYMGL